jgi:hypothetical protein
MHPEQNPPNPAAAEQPQTPHQKRNSGRTGPTSITGRATSSRNATRHGLCSSTLLITGENEADWNNLLASWLTEYQNPPENSVLYTFVVKTAQAEWFRQRAQKEYDFFLENYGEPAMYSWDPKRIQDHALLLRYVTAGERKFQREYRTLEHHWKTHPQPVKAEAPVEAPEPEASNDEMPEVLFINNETGEAVDAQGNKYPPPPGYIPTPIIPGVYPPGHLCYQEPTPNKRN